MFDFQALFRKTKSIKMIKKDLNRQQQVIQSYITQLSDRGRKRIEWCTVHGRECESAGLLMWEKDLDYRYTFLNTRHCNDFFRVSIAKVEALIGKTDAELIKEFTARTGLTNTFGDLCISTDIYTLKQNASCRFWELGYIGGKIGIFDVTKTPRYDGDVLVGTKSWALNLSNRECEVKALLELFLQSGEALRIDTKNGNETAAYLIKNKGNSFNGKFP